MKKTFFLFSMAAGVLLANVSTPLVKPQLKYWTEFSAAAQKHKVDPYLLYAIAQAESKMDPGAISGPQGLGTYSVGLMQISTGRAEKKDLLKPAINIEMGAQVLSECMNSKTQNIWEAVQCYNGGTLLSKGKFTKQVLSTYVKKVQKIYKEVKQGY